MYLRFLLPLFFLPLFGWTQSSDFSLIYKLSNAAYEEKIDSENFELTPEDCQVLIGASDTLGTLPAGYYIQAKAVGEELELSILDKTNIYIELLNNDRDLAVQVIDSLGNVLEDATVWLNGKKIKYDATTQSFRLKKRKKGGRLKVEANGQLLFYEVENRHLYNYKWRFSSTRFGRIVLTPIRMGKRVYYYFKRGLSQGYWDIYWPSLNPFRRIKIFQKKQIKGYIASDQPIYRHGDTLKIKAYVAKENGKTWAKKISLTIYQGSRGSGQPFRHYAALTPDENGNLLYELPLADSLTLDTRYSITISPYNGRYNGSLRHSFKLEDYQLNEVKYEFSTSKESYTRGEKVVLIAEGKDQNGMTIVDGSIQLIAKRGAVRNIADTMTYIPDTLWTTEQELNARGSTQIIFPDSLLPKGDLSIYIDAIFQNSNGELHERRHTFEYNALLDDYIIDLEDGFVKVEKLVKGQASEQTISLVESTFHGKKSEEIQLPYHAPLNPYVHAYWLIDDQSNVLKRLDFPSSDVQVVGSYEMDSISIQLLNPHRLPLNYWISKGEKIVAEGQTTDAIFEWKRKDNSHKVYHVRYQYIWRGNTTQDAVTVQHYKNQLNIAIDAPERVTPGEQAQIKVKVKDAAKNNAANVNLTAGAINARFNSTGNISDLEIEYKRPKKLKKYGEFEADQMDKTDEESQHPLTAEWIERFRLDDQLFYQLRLPKEGYITKYLPQDSFYQNVAQFAPHVIKDGQSQPVFMIYCNRDLVYYYEANAGTPYSFKGRAGYNNIVLRMRDFEYRIDSVLLKNGQKLELAIDADSWRQHKLIRGYFMPEILTDTEKKLLNERIFMLRNDKRDNGPAYVWQDTLPMHYAWLSSGTKKSERHLFGPFIPEQKLHFYQEGTLKTTFLFEPGFEYSLSRNRERLYHSNYLKWTKGLPKKLAYKKVGESLLKPYYLEEKKPVRSPKYTNYTSLSGKYVSNVYKGGSFAFEYKNNPKKLLAIAFKKKESKYIERFIPSLRYYNKMPTGDYTLVLLNEAEEYIEHPITIKKNQLLFLRFNEVDWQERSEKMLKKWFPEGRPTFSSRKLSENRQITLLNPEYGYVIEGRITDEEDEPLIGAGILVKETKIGTVTDLDGYYELLIPFEIDEPEIVVSYTGYATKSVVVDSDRQVNVYLEEGTLALSEVVVTGYGTSRLVEQANVSVNIIQGKAAGVSVDNRSRKTKDAFTLNQPADESNDDLFLAPSLGSDLRSNFKDHAFWQPDLMTDKNGEAYFTVTYPDDITSWNTFVVGMDRKLRAGVGYHNTRSFKPLMAQLAMPRFLVAGDETEIIGKAINYTNDTLAIQTQFELGDRPIQNATTDLIDGLVEKASIQAPLSSDSLQMTYHLTKDNYLDGEKRSIPIFRKGVEAVAGDFWVLNKDTTFIFQPTLDNGTVEVYVEEDAHNSLLRHLAYLTDYPYGCNEQTASRLLANFMKKKIYEQLQKSFESEANVLKMVKRLEKSQNTDGSWGWWSGNKRNEWMSVYVTKVLQAVAEDYPTKALAKGLRFLALNAEDFNPRLQLDAMMVLAKSDMPFNFKTTLVQYDTIQLDLYERLATTRIRQLLNQEYTLDSLYHYQRHTSFGGIYWEQNYAYWYDRNKQSTLLAYEILRAAGKSEELSYIRRWFLGQRSRHGRAVWQNTYQTATILYTILPEMLETDELEALKNKLAINGQVITKFPYRATFPASSTVKIEKTGRSFSFLTAYQQYFDPQPERADSLFDITTTLYQDGREVSTLEQGKQTTLKTRVTVKKRADYVMIEIPIPAACSYKRKPNGWRYPEVHREYFKEKTAIFCQKLEAGSYEFELGLEARFSGQYTLNPVRVEQMYFPVLDGNNEVKELTVR
ncbi:MAG: alpha-2-macroglobulin family protein [Bacteroidota bacterium]